MGAGCIRYRAKIGPGYGGATKRQNASRPNQQVVNPQNQPQNLFEPGRIASATVEQLVDANSADILQQINEVASRKSYAPVAYLSVTFLCLILLVTIPWLALLAAILFAYPVWKLSKLERVAMTYALFFDLDQAEQAEWDQRLEGMRHLSNSNKVWRVVTSVDVIDKRRSAGAGSEVRRLPVSFVQDAAPRLTANIKPLSINAGNQTLVFLPDRLYIYENGRYGAVEYAALQIDLREIQFAETEAVPTDSQIVGRTWRYVNNSGTADRRFKENYEIPIAQYANLTLRSNTGLNMVFYGSSIPAAKKFHSGFTGIKSTSGPKASGARGQHRSGTQSRVPGPSAGETTPWCFLELNVTINSTRDEVTAAYRTMAKAYHPDVVAHLAHEFRALAEERMTTINAAYAEIKAMKGWQ
jgi:hypothetical protein